MQQKAVQRILSPLIISLIAICCLTAQNEGNIWYFGENAGIDFNSGAPVALTNGPLYTLEGCATICDATGSLLSCTDGISVWNSIHFH